MNASPSENLRHQFESAAAFIERHNDFLLTAHVGADGDAYGALLAMAWYLRQRGKRYEMVLSDATIDEKYHFLEGWSEIRSFDPHESGEYRAGIAVDVPSRKRIGVVAGLLPSVDSCLQIDHHPFEDNLAAVRLVDTGASSACQIIFQFLEALQVEMDSAVATALYAGLIYDNGKFCNSNTSAEDFRIARQLVLLGVQPNRVANQIFATQNVVSIITIGAALSTLQLYLNDKVAVIFCPYERMNIAGQLDLDVLANYSVSVQGVEAGLFVREVEPQTYKVSLRSRGVANVGRVAVACGGGGHEHAAGCLLTGTFDEVINRLLEELAKEL